MAYADLQKDVQEIVSGLDDIVVINALGDIPGGRTLDFTGFNDGVDVLKAGHIIIEKDGVFKPMPLNGGKTEYASLPSNHSYVGVLKATVTKKDPRAAIVTIGQINAAACPFAIPSGAKNALKNIQFLYES